MYYFYANSHKITMNLSKVLWKKANNFTQIMFIMQITWLNHTPFNFNSEGL